MAKKRRPERTYRAKRLRAEGSVVMRRTAERGGWLLLWGVRAGFSNLLQNPSVMGAFLPPFELNGPGMARLLGVMQEALSPEEVPLASEKVGGN